MLIIWKKSSQKDRQFHIHKTNYKQEESSEAQGPSSDTIIGYLTNNEGADFKVIKVSLGPGQRSTSLPVK